eukprot:scaffold2469_cov149-Skeletonema_menzelii.AAC.13
MVSETVIALSQELLADADEIEAALVHITRPSAKVLMQSLITNLRKDGKALQSTSAAVRYHDTTSEASPGPVERAATPSKISPITKQPVATSFTISQNRTQTSPAQDNYPDDDTNELIHEGSQSQKRQKATAEAAAVSEKENAWSAPTRTNDQETLHKARDQNSFTIDLSDVPTQPPIPKSAGHIKEGASKYAGVCFKKQSKKWIAQISIDGKSRLIGLYDNEEEAAVDYARAVFKYRSEEKLKNARANKNLFVIDLSDVPPQRPIPKEGLIKEGSSKYVGVCFNKQSKKWVAGIRTDGKRRHIGSDDVEEDAAVDYARAAFKYRSGEEPERTRKRSSFVIDLSDVPPQQPMLKCDSLIKEGSSKYAGCRLIGRYDVEEEAAVDYARAVFKYKSEENFFDLDDVPPQQLIPKCDDRIKEGSSKYVGVCFNKSSEKWIARINIDGKRRHIGSYDTEEEAAADYARAAFKFNIEEKAERARKKQNLKTLKRKRKTCAEEIENVRESDTSKRLKSAELKVIELGQLFFSALSHTTLADLHFRGGLNERTLSATEE